MHPHAPNPAAQPHLFLKRLQRTVLMMRRRAQRQWRNAVHLRHSLASSDDLRFGRTSAAEKREDDFGTEGFSPARIPPLHGHCFGA